MRLPRLSGSRLLMARVASEAPAANAFVRQLLRRQLGVDELAKLPASARGDLPIEHRPIRARSELRVIEGTLPLPGELPAHSPGQPPFHGHRRALDYAEAFRSGRTTPREVAERSLALLDRFASGKPTMNVLASSDSNRTRAEADASTRRYRDKKSLGPLDGVPFLVKDQQDVAGLPTTLGTPAKVPPAERDATLVARLRDAGAVFLGKTVLTEWGLSPIGANHHFRMPHNPFDPTRAAGGSSTGSAVGVALGLCPLATAGDGGGSIRVPAALNGLFGIKPTFGRVSRHGDGFKESVATPGPIGTSTTDLALFLDAVSTRPDPNDPQTSWAAPPPAGGFLACARADVRGLSIGIVEDERRDAATDIQSACQAALQALESRGVALKTVKIPLARHATKIGYLTIGCEALAYHRDAWLAGPRVAINDDLRLSFAALSGITSLEFLDAQRLRRGLANQVAAALRTVDVLAL